jgi:hypothetical protein
MQLVELREVVGVLRDEEVDTRFSVVTMNRLYQLESDSTSEAIEWVHLIACAVREANLQADLFDQRALRDSQERSELIESSPPDRYHLLPQVRKQGWLRKKGQVVHNWRWRFFTLQVVSSGHAVLRYYLCPDTFVCQGSLSKTLCSCADREVTGGRRYQLHADSSQYQRYQPTRSARARTSSRTDGRIGSGSERVGDPSSKGVKAASQRVLKGAGGVYNVDSLLNSQDVDGGWSRCGLSAKDLQRRTP